MALIVYVGDNPSVFVPDLAGVVFHEDPPDWLNRSWDYDLGGVVIAGEAVDVEATVAASLLLQPANWQAVDDDARQIVTDLLALAEPNPSTADPGPHELTTDPAEDGGQAEDTDPAPAEDGKAKSRRRN